jgi:hypothetical protein
MPTATQTNVTYYLWEELTWPQHQEIMAQYPATVLDGQGLRNALWFRGPVDGGRWERIPLHPSDAARLRCPARG